MTTASRSIQILPDLVVNKIAAGEVVERPASVLKELMENALDAGATQVDVEVAGGGRLLVAVSDDGVGMGRDDALLSIERHATSKLRDIGDLDHLQTLGFRGEALAAIASVSQFTLTTRPRESAAGTELSVMGGKLKDVRDAGCPPGTSIQVRHLFFNVPARRKFLRSEQTELAHLRQVFVEQALSHPERGMKMTADGRELHRLTGGATLEDRLRELYGKEVARWLRPVKGKDSLLEVEGLISLPEGGRSDRSEQHIFINGRVASAPLIAYSITEACRQIYPRGRHPVLVLNLRMDPASVDVNVHPAKREVRFRNPTLVRDFLVEVLRSAFTGGLSPAIPVADLSAFQMPPRAKDTRELFPSIPSRVPDPAVRYPSAPPAEPFRAPAPISAPPEKPMAPGKEPWSWHRILGQVGGHFVVMETEDGLVLLDPQAAHERVLYERFMADAKRRKVVLQGLLSPQTVELPPRDAARIRENLPTLKQLGFGVSEFGQDAFLVDALPAGLGDVSPEKVLAGVAEALEEMGARSGAARDVEDSIAQSACRTAVRFHKQLAPQEMEQLVNDLAKTMMPYTCPHGRPTVIYMGFDELNRKFGRT